MAMPPMVRPSEEELTKNQERVFKLVAMMPEARRELVEDMLHGPVGDIYFTAPASSREDFHSCYPGGLCQHSLNVVRTLKKLSAALCPDRWPDHQLAFVGLFHDLGKVGDGEHEMYVPNLEHWQRNKGRLYELNKEAVFMPTSERGLFILQGHGIEINAEEYLTIRLNDGPYPPENEPYKMHEPDLALITHWADRWASSQEKLLQSERKAVLAST